MEKILSQDEVDALLRGVTGGDVDTTPKEEDLEAVRRYDLSNQDRIMRGRMPTLEMINDRFMRLMSMSWGNILRRPVEFSVQDTGMFKFGEFLKKVPVPSSLTLFQMPPLRGRALLVFDAMLVYLLVDFYYGGNYQTHVKPEGREFTPPQNKMIRLIAETTLTDLAKAWYPVVPVKMHINRSESNPQFAMVVSAPEIVMALTIRAHLGDMTRDFFIAYPYAMIEPIKEKLYSGFFSDQQEEDDGWRGRFRTAIEQLDIDVTVELANATVPIDRINQLRVGDVIMLKQGPGDPSIAYVEGVPKLHGHPSQHRGANALTVLQRILDD